MKTFIYCRVSSVGQQDNYSFAAQKKDGIAFAKSIVSDYKIYKDIESGKKSTRKGWEELKAELESLSEPDDVIWYGSQSRLLRDGLEFQVFKKICTKKKLRLFEKKENRFIDFAASSGDRMMAGIKSIIDEEEVLEINRRTLEGLYASWDEGMRAHTRIYGYECSTYDEKGNRIWKIVPAEAETIKMVFNLYEKSTTVYEIVKRLNQTGYRTRSGKFWDNTKVKHLLGHVAYSGRTTDSKGNIISSKKYPVIIKPDKFDRIGKFFITRKNKNARGRPPFYEGSGILKCGVCGAGFYLQKVRDRKYYHHKDSTGCGGAKLRKYEACNYILEFAYGEALLYRPDNIFKSLKNQIKKEEGKIEADVDRIDKLIKEAEKERDNFLQAIKQGKQIEYFTGLIDSKLQEITKLKQDKEILIKNLDMKTKSYEQMEAEFTFDNLIRYIQLTNTQDKRDMLKRVITNAWIQKNEIKVDLIDGRSLFYNYKEILKSGIYREGSFFGNLILKDPDFLSLSRAKQIEYIKTMIAQTREVGYEDFEAMKN